MNEPSPFERLLAEVSALETERATLDAYLARNPEPSPPRAPESLTKGEKRTERRLAQELRGAEKALARLRAAQKAEPPRKNHRVLWTITAIVGALLVVGAFTPFYLRDRALHGPLRWVPTLCSPVLRPSDAETTTEMWSPAIEPTWRVPAPDPNVSWVERDCWVPDRSGSSADPYYVEVRYTEAVGPVPWGVRYPAETRTPAGLLGFTGAFLLVFALLRRPSRGAFAVRRGDRAET